VYISDPDELASFCERASSSKILAVDTEFLREKTYHPRLCLIQIATPSESAAVDPLVIEDLSALRALLVDDDITKVFHACTQDLEVILHALGCVPHPVFDTQLAAAFLGHRQQIGYGALVESCCGVHLPKAESLTDWARRPLDDEQLRYAEDDVIYLPRIYDQMMGDLVRQDRLSWLMPELESLTAPEHYVRRPEEAYIHLKRSSSLTRRQLAVAREVCAWREQVAERRDVPRRWVLSDEVVVETCRRTPKNPESLSRIRGTEQLGRRDAQGICDAVRRGLACKVDDLPVKRRHERPSAQTESVLDLMYALLRVVSEETGIAGQLIATREDLHDFLGGANGSRLSHGWRHDLLGERLELLLSGEIGLTVKDGHLETL
jgi:ribonuclease D